MTNAKRLTIIVIVGYVMLQAVLVTLIGINLNSNMTANYEQAGKKNVELIVQQLEKSAKLEDVNLQALELYNFSNLLFVSEDGFILETKNSFAETNVYSFLKVGTEDFKNSDFLVERCFIGDVQQVAYVIDVRFRNDRTVSKIVVYEPAEMVGKAIRGTIVLNVTMGALQILFTAGIVTFLTYYFVKKSEELNYIRFKTQNYYVITINRAGKILKQSENFKREFAMDNIGEFVINNGENLIQCLTNHLPIEMLVRKEDNENARFIKWIVGREGRGYKLVGLDESDEYNKTHKLNKSVYIDSITGMDNDNALELDLNELLACSERKRLEFAVIELKNIEDLRILFGEEKGKEILLTCVDKIREKFSEVAYFVRQKYFIVMSDVESGLKQKVNEFMAEVNLPMKIDDNLILVHSYCAYLNFNNEDKTVTLDEILRYAEYLLAGIDKEKKEFLVSQQFTKSKYNLTIGAKNAIVKSIIEEKGIELFFQPQVCATDGRIVSFESLVRLNKGDVIDMTTQDFIMIAELNGYMIPLGEIIYEQAFEFAKRIQGKGVSVGVNISPIQLMQVGFVENFLRKYKEYELQPDSVSVEITETFLMRNIDENIAKLRILQDNSISVHLDDFGKGYSSLTYLKRLPIGAIKIDREFVDDISTNKYSRAVAKIVIEICKDLNLISIAEGVETIEQSQILLELGCDVYQGYLYGKAVNADKAERMASIGFADDKIVKKENK